MIREVVLKDFPNWTSEKQLSEYQAYKRLGSYSPFSDADYSLMEMVMNNPNAEVLCKDGICNIKYDDNTFSLDDILEEKYEMGWIKWTNKNAMWQLLDMAGWEIGMQKN